MRFSLAVLWWFTNIPEICHCWWVCTHMAYSLCLPVYGVFVLPARQWPMTLVFEDLIPETEGHPSKPEFKIAIHIQVQWMSISYICYIDHSYIFIHIINGYILYIYLYYVYIYVYITCIFQTLGFPPSQVNDFPFPYKIDIEVQRSHGNVVSTCIVTIYKVVDFDVEWLEIMKSFRFSCCMKSQNQ